MSSARRFRFAPVLLAALAAAIGPAALAQAPLWVPGKPAMSSKAAAAAEAGALRDPSFPAAAVRAFRLQPLAASARRLLDEPAANEKRVRIGLPRDVATELGAIEGPAALQWLPAPAGGYVTRLAYTSPGAASLRVGLAIRELPQGAELRFGGGAGSTSRIGSVAGDAALEASRAQGVFWTALTEGETQAVEVWVRSAADAARVRLAATTISHLGTSPANVFKSTGPGASQGCHLDVACAAASNPALAQAARSVAKLVFTENGSSYLCSGTLVNDGAVNAQVPYVYTAAHCIDTQAAASSLNTFWFYEAAACGQATLRPYRQLAGGASLLKADVVDDVSLLRLNEPAPDGAWFSGWDARPLEKGAAIVAIHHPMGDVKKASMGQALEATAASGPYTTAAWLSGSTEGGSSGSGLFTLVNGEYVLRGALRGGSASCASTGRVEDPANRDYYSRIDIAMPALKAWLSAAPAPMNDYTGIWWNAAENGWGMSITQGTKNGLFVAWYTYDAAGRPTWLVVTGGAWTSTTTYEATMYRTAGSPYDGAYQAGRFAATAAGTLRLDFADDNRATLHAVVDGKAIDKAITRFDF